MDGKRKLIKPRGRRIITISRLKTNTGHLRTSCSYKEKTHPYPRKRLVYVRLDSFKTLSDQVQ